MRKVLFVLLVCGSVASALTPSQYWRTYYSDASVDLYGEPLPVGSVVRAFDPEGVECGVDTVGRAGWYGYLYVYGDAPDTPEVDEGAMPGDTIRFTVDGLPYLAHPPVVWVSWDIFPYQADLYPDSSFLLTGTVRYATTLRPILGVSLTLSGPTSGALTTKWGGRFAYGPLGEGHYTVALGALSGALFRSAITAYDASLVLRHVLTGMPLPSPLVVADVSGDDTVSAYDASLILQRAVGLLDAFPRPRIMWSNHDSVAFDHVLQQMETAEFVIQAVGDVSGNWTDGAPRLAGGGASLIPEEAEGGFVYRLRSAEPVYALDWEIAVAGEGPKLALPDGWFVETYRRDETLRVSAAGAMPLEENYGALVSLAPLRVWGTLNEGVSVRSELPDEAVKPAPALVVTASPNPFNPSTRIRLEALEPGMAEVRIWSVTGQLMFAQAFDARSGAYEVRWEGTDLTGLRAASGLYLCRAAQGSRTAHVRLLLLR